MRIVFCLIVLIQGLIFVSCKKCKEDEAFKKEFLNCIRVVEKIQLEGYFFPGNYSESFECRVFSIECLTAITGYEGYVDKGNEPHYFYQYADSVDVDLKVWRDWYENNKCSFTMQMADSLLKKHGATLRWPVSADSLVIDSIYAF